MKKYIYPVKEPKISSGFGLRVHPKTKQKQQHYGIDFSAKEGTEVVSVADGVVIFEGFNGENGYFENGQFVMGSGFGNNIFILHEDGQISHYAHLKCYNVKAGDRVLQGQKIGEVGSTGASTGAHLHFEMLDGNMVVSNTNKTITQILISQNKIKDKNSKKHIGFGGSVGRYDPINEIITD